MIAVITRDQSDILKVLDKNLIEYELLHPEFKQLNEYRAVMILGGTEEEPLKLKPQQRQEIERFIDQGGKVFAEYIVSLGAFTSDGIQDARFERFAWIDDSVAGLQQYEIIDPQSSFRIVPFHEVLESRKVLARFTSDHAHSYLYEDLRHDFDVKDYAIFLERENVLVSAVQLAQFRQNRYAPVQRIDALISHILTWLLDEKVDASLLKAPYSLNNRADNREEVVLKAIDWFDEANILIEGGRGGVYEGFGTEIYGDGQQRFASNVRGDCVGEASWLYYLAGHYFEDESYAAIAENLRQVALKDFTVQSGFHAGFVRWSDAAWESNYGDDVARMIMPILFKNLLGDQDEEELAILEKILNFHLKTTGSDGLRRGRFEIEEINEENIHLIQKEEDQTASAHYNAYYHASLLLGYRLLGHEAYLDYGQKGLDKLLGMYPKTKREQSQTQEEARLILPVSIALWVTEDPKYERFLESIVSDMKKRLHPSGAYLEWDEGYQASMRHTKGDGECSLLSRNGDTVVDLLYTNNWLPFAFAMAYIATDNEAYLDDFENIVSFLSKIQMRSDLPEIDGVWARGFDPDLKEYFGSPADKGWGPYCVESGWTVSQIASGILLSLILDEFKENLGKGALK